MRLQCVPVTHTQGASRGARDTVRRRLRRKTSASHGSSFKSDSEARRPTAIKFSSCNRIGRVDENLPHEHDGGAGKLHRR